MVVLNAFEPGQEHALHAHEGMYKIYQVIEGRGCFLLEDDDVPMQAGVLMVAPEGVPHGIRNTGTERLLVLVVLETAVNSGAVTTQEQGKQNLAPIAIGLAVYLGHSFLIPVDGCSINPTRTIGPAIVATFRVEDAGPIWSAMWVFWVGPCVGALLAVFVYEKAYAALPGAAGVAGAGGSAGVAGSAEGLRPRGEGSVRWRP